MQNGVYIFVQHIFRQIASLQVGPFSPFRYSGMAVTLNWIKQRRLVRAAVYVYRVLEFLLS